jgi:hypothetical protein
MLGLVMKVLPLGITIDRGDTFLRLPHRHLSRLPRHAGARRTRSYAAGKRQAGDPGP